MKKTLRKAFTILTATIITTLTVATPVFAKDVSDYTDVHETDWFYTTVADVADKGLMLGTGDSTFAPTQNLERGQLATILYRMSGETSAYGYRFPDVADGIFYSEAITWAADAGVVSGYNDGTFGPSDKITREQLATMLYRYADRYGYDTSVTGDVNSFSDGNKVSGFAMDAMSWAVGAGILKGEANGRLNPQGDVSRAVAATMISSLIVSLREFKTINPDIPVRDLCLDSAYDNYATYELCRKWNPHFYRSQHESGTSRLYPGLCLY